MRRRATGTRTVRTATTVKVSNAGGTSGQIDAELTYEPTDPFAVTLTFRDHAGPVPWTFARELLLEGVFEPVGEGDVHVWPCLSPTGVAVVMIELDSVEGGVMVEVASRLVSGFLADTLALVPRGRESRQYDVDAALAGMLA